MRAAWIETCGRPPVVADRPAPVPGPGTEVVRVSAAPITPLDLLCAGGTSYFGMPAVPYVPGVQGVGTAGGTPVWFATTAGMAPGDGSMAELALVRDEDLVKLPAGASPIAVAALGLSAVAAYLALTWRGELVAGEQVLVLGGGGVVGQAAIQLARLNGARRVVAGARSPGGRERATRAGADAVVSLGTDRGTEDVAELAARFSAACDGPVDLVLDPLFGVPAAAAARTLGKGGRLVNLGGSASETCPLDSATLRSRSLRVLGYTNNELTLEQRAAAITMIAEQAALGRLTVAHEVVPLEAAGEAWQRQAAGTAGGRIVLSIA
ncbi:quinone oxidoreductase family protein [Nonomuraea guangzhouensis]|uniref:Zinc-binding alcohol dehydrogenase family protein n=1 Tax=Nonomuraea guangzhouensis TaxID=1291555 RepID=A0ABW4GEJ1_9ACTN|nr:zinc-binding dehydrogenase [Nonomuraea guangzhouensis]